MDEEPHLLFATATAFDAWLDTEGAAAGGLWLRVPRAGSGVEGIRYPEALQVALCHGWIDGQSRKGDDPDVWLQRFTPRRPRSLWSKVNCGYVERLIAEGRMRPRGLAEVEAAKADGRWDRAYSSSSVAAVPDDLAAALAAVPGARAFFDGLDSRNRYAVLHRIEIVKRPETRARKIAEYAAMLGRGEKLDP
jgi:uncharacterized protein YdeI (YjbR/CyaY-like superfamily)